MKNSYIPLIVLVAIAVIAAGAMIMGNTDNDKIMIDEGGLEAEYPLIDGEGLETDAPDLQPIKTIATIVGIETWDDTLVILLDQDDVEIGEGYPCDIYLMISKDTTITDSNENVLTADELTDGMRIEAYYGPMTTRSLPPQSGAVSIVVLDENLPVMPQPVETIGTVLGTEDWNGKTVILLDEDDADIGEGYPCDIYLITGPETEVTDSDGNKLTIEDITKGTRIEAQYGPMVTLSLPPQSGTLKIIVL